MSDIDAEARGIARQARAALREASERHKREVEAALFSGSPANPKSRARMLARMKAVDPTLFVAEDRAKRSRDIYITLAWFVVTDEPQRLGITSLFITGAVRGWKLDTVPNLDMHLSAHAQGRMVQRLGLRTLTQQLAALEYMWRAMQATIVATDVATDPENLGVGRNFYIPCGPALGAGPLGLAIVAHSEPLFCEVITILDRDQLGDEQQAIMDLWLSQSRLPTLQETEAKRGTT